MRIRAALREGKLDQAALQAMLDSVEAASTASGVFRVAQGAVLPLALSPAKPTLASIAVQASPLVASVLGPLAYSGYGGAAARASLAGSRASAGAASPGAGALGVPTGS